MTDDTPRATPSARKRVRAKRACVNCNARRVKCNVTDVHPCSNCAMNNSRCETVPSKRGKYSRAARKSTANEHTTASQNADEEHPNPVDRNTSPDAPTPFARGRLSYVLSPVSANQASPTSNHTTTSSEAVGNRIFFGESNLLTSVTGRGSEANELNDPAGPEIAQSDVDVSGDVADDASRFLSRRSETKASKLYYLTEEGALKFPDYHDYVPVLRGYFTWFHPCFPVLDKGEVARTTESGEISPLLLNSILFVGITYCDDSTINRVGFSERVQAKAQLYHRAKILFEADWERNPITVIQSLFLMSFWRANASSFKHVRYWLSNAISVAQDYGFHRSSSCLEDKQAKLRRRIWWSIYVRDRQAAASLGLPSRIRDQDCDVELLNVTDLEDDTSLDLPGFMKHPTSEHLEYAPKMASAAVLLGKIIDTFSPGMTPNVDDVRHQLKGALEQWKTNLPPEFHSIDVEPFSVGKWLLHLAYNHLLILLHRKDFEKTLPKQDESGHDALKAACRISRIVEDMLSAQMIQFSQMHSITSIFAALCIHTADLQRSQGVAKRLAENRARLCLLGLKEIQKYWKINNLVLEMFFKCVDKSVAQRLLDEDPETSNKETPPLNLTSASSSVAPDQTGPMNDQSFGPAGMQRSSGQNVVPPSVAVMQDYPDFTLQGGTTNDGFDDFTAFLNSEDFLNGVGIPDFDILQRAL